MLSETMCESAIVRLTFRKLYQAFGLYQSDVQIFYLDADLICIMRTVEHLFIWLKAIIISIYV